MPSAWVLPHCAQNYQSLARPLQGPLSLPGRCPAGAAPRRCPPGHPQQPRTLSRLPASCFSGDGESALKLGCLGCNAEAALGRAGPTGAAVRCHPKLSAAHPLGAAAPWTQRWAQALLCGICALKFTIWRQASGWVAFPFPGSELGSPETPVLLWEPPVLRALVRGCGAPVGSCPSGS